MYKVGDKIKCICDTNCIMRGTITKVIKDLYIVEDSYSMICELYHYQSLLVWESPAQPANSKLNEGGNV